MRNNFGKGKSRQGNTNLFKDNKTGRLFIWDKGKWVDVTASCKEVDEILGYIFDDEEWHKHVNKINN